MPWSWPSPAWTPAGSAARPVPSALSRASFRTQARANAAGRAAGSSASNSRRSPAVRHPRRSWTAVSPGTGSTSTPTGSDANAANANAPPCEIEKCSRGTPATAGRPCGPPQTGQVSLNSRRSAGSQSRYDASSSRSMTCATVYRSRSSARANPAARAASAALSTDASTSVVRSARNTATAPGAGRTASAGAVPPNRTGIALPPIGTPYRGRRAAVQSRCARRGGPRDPHEPARACPVRQGGAVSESVRSRGGGLDAPVGVWGPRQPGERVNDDRSVSQDGR